MGRTPRPRAEQTQKAKPTRIDGVVANKAAASLIEGFEVEKDEAITTHDVLKLKLKMKAAREEKTYAAPLTLLKHFPKQR